MKLKRWSQNLLAVTAAIGTGTGLVSCGTSNTIDYLYVTSAKNNPGQINVYLVDSQSGALTQIPDSPFQTQQRNPVSLVADSQGKNLYVAGHDDNTIAQYSIGTDAKLYGQHTLNPSGSEPVALAVHTYANGEFLFVVETYQPNFTDLNKGPGALYVYNLGTDGALGTLVPQTVNGQPSDFVPLGNTPKAVNVTADGKRVFAADILTSSQPGCGAGLGGVDAYNMGLDSSGNATGVLQPVAGSPFCAGTTPSAIASHPFSTFLYVTDSTQNNIITYGINTTSNPGALLPLPSSPVAAGTAPDGIVVDPRGLYVYVANFNGTSINGYGINQATGQLSSLASGTQTAGAQPGCVIVEPALGRFVYTATYVQNSVYGYVLDPNTGALSATEGTFYATSGQSSCVAAVPHGNHPVITTANTAGPS